METFTQRLEMRQKENFRINDIFWKEGMYNGCCSKAKILSVFKDMKHYCEYSTLMERKVENEAKLNGCTKNEIIKEIMASKLYRNHFAKKAIKQSTHENTQKDVMYDFICELKKEYPMIGFSFDDNKENKYAINDKGVVVSKIDEETRPYTESKLFDFRLLLRSKGKTFNIFFDNKATSGNGGSQDNTCREMQSTHKYCLLNKEKHVFFYFILDGDYWKHRKASISTAKNILRSDVFGFKETIVKFIHDYVLK